MKFGEMKNVNLSTLLDDGCYLGKIIKVTKEGASTNGKYCQLQIDLFSENNKRVGAIFETISESESEISIKKSYRLIRALGMSFKDDEEFTISRFISKLNRVKDNMFKVDITTQSQDNYRPRNIADINYGVFYLLNEDTTETISDVKVEEAL